MIRWLCLGCILFLFNAPLAFAADRYDGNWWREENKHFRLGYLSGYIAGLQTVSNRIDPEGKQYPGFRFGSYTIGQIYDELDKFYGDPANRHVQIDGAIAWVKRKLEGESEEKLQKGLEFLRKRTP